MAKVGDSVRKAIADWEAGDPQFAMLHACNAIDGTAAKLHRTLGSNARFTRLLRDNYDVLGPMGSPGIDLVNTRWPVKVERPKASGGVPDIADVIYGIHRCCHGHGSELPDGFELLPDAAGPTHLTHVQVSRGKVQLSDRIIFGLLSIAVFSNVNTDQKVPPAYHLKLGDDVLPINEWWGRKADFLLLVQKYSMPSVTMDFNDWMDAAQ